MAVIPLPAQAANVKLVCTQRAPCTLRGRQFRVNSSKRASAGLCFGRHWKREICTTRWALVQTPTVKWCATLQQPDSSNSTDAEADSSSSQSVSIGRRTLQATFTCNKCGARTKRLVNPVAWEKGLVFAQCAGCDVWHKLRDEANMIDEIVYVDADDPGRPEPDMSNSHLFDSCAAAYAAYRPHYPAALYERIYRFCDFQGKPQTALDIATGSGQAAVELAKSFVEVIAIDDSQQQLEKAKNEPNIVYRKGLAEETGVSGNSVDLVTVAQALHWFDLPRFFCEAARILKPGSALVTWGYGLPEFDGHQQATSLLVDFAYGEHKLGPYWSHKRQLIQEEYASIVPDPMLFEPAVRDKVHSHMTWTIDLMINYISTWSAHGTHRQRHPEEEDPLIQFKRDLMATLDVNDGSCNVAVVWPIFMLLAKTKH